MATLSIFVIMSFLPSIIALDPYSKFIQLNLPSGATGPESVALDSRNEGPYCAISDGRVLKYIDSNTGFVDFAYTSPKRTKQLCDGTTDANLGPTCGRPLGFSFDNLINVLYIVDAFLGLFKVGPDGGLATLLANSAGGVKLNFLTGIDVNPITRDVYITDASLTYDLRNITQPNLVTDSSGRLIKYNPRKNEVTVLQEGLSVPIGPAVSFDGSFVLFSEYSAKRVVKYWLLGPKANTSEVLRDLPGNPSKVKRASNVGEFWVAVDINVQQPRFTTPYGYKIDSFGNLLFVKDFEDHYYNVPVSVVQEYFGTTLLVGSRGENFVGIYKKTLF
nr:protein STRICTOSIDINE SYNTHASE-LIKE 11-like [Coffea arabica]